MKSKLRTKSIIWYLVFIVSMVSFIVVLLIDASMTRQGYVLLGLLLVCVIYFIAEMYVERTITHEEYEDPMIGRGVEVIEDFVSVSDGFEGRVLANGAPWPARFERHKLRRGDRAVIGAIQGGVLALTTKQESMSD